MQLKIDEIVVKKRIRRDLGDIESLARSIEKHGLMNPILVTDKKVLIAGERRLQAVKFLGWETVPVRIIEQPDKIESLELEIDENIFRKAFTTDEAGDAFEMLDRLNNPGFFRKLINWLGALILKIKKRLTQLKK